MPRSKQIQEQMRNKIVAMYQSGKCYKAISNALDSSEHGQSHYPQMEKNCNSGEPSQGWQLIIDGTMNSALYQKILKENVRPSVCDLKLKRTWVMLQDNDPKHTSKSTSEWLKKN